MEAELRANLLSCAKAYAEAQGLEVVTVARLAAGDWRFFERMQNGRGFTARKYDEVVAWFSSHWPERVAWPASVPRPLHKAVA